MINKDEWMTLNDAAKKYPWAKSTFRKWAAYLFEMDCINKFGNQYIITGDFIKWMYANVPVGTGNKIKEKETN